MKKVLILSAIIGLMAAHGAYALESEGKCIVASDKSVTSSAWTTICSTSVPKFSSDPGSGVTVFDIDASAISLDMTNALNMGFGYQLVENCAGVYANDPHAISIADLASFGGITPPMPAVGVLHPSNDPLGSAACTVSVQARAYNGSGTIVVKADQDHATSGIDDATAFHIVAYNTN